MDSLTSITELPPVRIFSNVRTGSLGSLSIEDGSVTLRVTMGGFFLGTALDSGGMDGPV